MRFVTQKAQEKTTTTVSAPAVAAETPVTEVKAIRRSDEFERRLAPFENQTAQEKTATTVSASAVAVETPVVQVLTTRRSKEFERRLAPFEKQAAQEKTTTTVSAPVTASDNDDTPRKEQAEEPLNAAAAVYTPEETLSAGAIYAHKQMIKDTGCHRWWDPMHVHREDYTPDLVKSAMSDHSYDQEDSFDIRRTEYPNLDKGRFVDYSYYCPVEEGLGGMLFFTGGEEDENEQVNQGSPLLRSAEVSFYTAKSPESPEPSFDKDMVRSDGPFAELSNSLQQSIGEDLAEVMSRRSASVAAEPQAESSEQADSGEQAHPNEQAEEAVSSDEADDDVDDIAEEVEDFEAENVPSEQTDEAEEGVDNFAEEVEDFEAKIVTENQIPEAEQPLQEVAVIKEAEVSAEPAMESNTQAEVEVASPQRYSHAEKTTSLLDTPVHQPFAKEVDHELNRILDGADIRHILSQKSHEIPFADYLEFEPDDTQEIDKWAFELGLECRSLNRKKKNIDKWVEKVAVEKEPGMNGKLFVKVLKLENIDLPVPPEAVYFTCTVDNGIHEVTTEWLPFNRNAEINQEFVFMANPGLEFTLTLKFRLDSKLDSPDVQRQKPRTGLSKILLSPRKIPGPKYSEKYLSLMRSAGPDGSFAKSYVAFDQLSERCDSQIFTVSYPLLSEWQKNNSPLQMRKGTPTAQQPNVVGTILMQMIYAPRTDGLQAPDIDDSEYPRSLGGCLVALRIAEWHKKKWYEGPMAQLGGGTTYWKRRHYELIGGKLIARNEITKKLVEVMDLSRAVYLSDDGIIPIERGARKVSDLQRKRKASRANEPPPTPMLPPASSSSKRFHKNMRLMTEANKRAEEQDLDTFYPVERSFRIVFKDGMVASFYTDTEEQRQDWLKVLGALIGKVPANNMWAARVLRKRELQSGDKSRNVSDRSARTGYESTTDLGPTEEEIGSRKFKPSTRPRSTNATSTVLYCTATPTASSAGSVKQGPAGPANAARRK